MTAELKNELSRDEGERLTSYLDSLGYWTIGIGHLIDPKLGADPAPFGRDLRFGGSITGEQSATLLEQDIAEKQAELDKHLPWWRDMDEVRQRVITNMIFNMGMKRLLGFANTLAKMKDGDYAGAASGMLKSRWAGQVHARATRLAKMMETGAV